MSTPREQLSSLAAHYGCLRALLCLCAVGRRGHSPRGLHDQSFNVTDSALEIVFASNADVTCIPTAPTNTCDISFIAQSISLHAGARVNVRCWPEPTAAAEF
jgi:hypothetical protein